MDLSALNKSISDLASQVEQTEGTEQSAVVLIQGFADAVTKAVADALAADAAANEASVAAATQAIQETTARFTASASKLGAAVAA